jgi:hypothetical protein
MADLKPPVRRKPSRKTISLKNIESTRMNIPGARNKNYGAEPGVTDNFVQCHSRGGAALCATARNV